MYKIILGAEALKDAQNIEQSNLKDKVVSLLSILKTNPFQYPPPYKKLRGNLFGSYSRRINRQHRLVYQVAKEQNEIKIISMWNHYE
jgi:Txe/YoeB family toxin of toxin-antitoxin system